MLGLGTGCRRLEIGLIVMFVGGCGGHVISGSGETRNDPESRPEIARTTLSAGAFHNCAIRSDDSLECWTLGELRAEDDHGQASAPPGRFTDVAASWSHSCAVDDAGNAACWGRSPNEYFGQADPPPGRFAKVNAGEKLTCALDQEGKNHLLGAQSGDAVRSARGQVHSDRRRLEQRLRLDRTR